MSLGLFGARVPLLDRWKIWVLTLLYVKFKLINISNVHFYKLSMTGLSNAKRAKLTQICTTISTMSAHTFCKTIHTVICKTLNTLVYIRHRSISRCHFLAIPKHCKSNYHTLWQLVEHSHQVLCSYENWDKFSCFCCDSPCLTDLCIWRELNNIFISLQHWSCVVFGECIVYLHFLCVLHLLLKRLPHQLHPAVHPTVQATTGPGVQAEVSLSVDPRSPWGSCTVEFHWPDG